jgi:anti-anti-sigma factor
MRIAIEESDAGNQIALEGTIDIDCAAELKAAFLKALDSGREIHVLLDGMAYMDVTAVQLLWAGEQQARRSGIEFRISGPLPEPVSTELADAGFPSLPALVNAG